MPTGPATAIELEAITAGRYVLPPGGGVGFAASPDPRVPRRMQLGAEPAILHPAMTVLRWCLIELHGEDPGAMHAWPAGLLRAGAGRAGAAPA